MRRYMIAVAYLPAALSFLIFCLYFFLTQPFKVNHHTSVEPKISKKALNFNDFKFYAALPAILGSQNSTIVAGDARAYIIERFIKKYNLNSPLLPYTYFLVDTADRYNLHFALLPAIAMQESNLCKRIPTGSKNCWGLGIYGDKVWRFDTYEEAIEETAKTLSRYATKGKLQPEEIMKLYTPQSQGNWAIGVRKFMQEMD